MELLYSLGHPFKANYLKTSKEVELEFNNLKYMA